VGGEFIGDIELYKIPPLRGLDDLSEYDYYSISIRNTFIFYSILSERFSVVNSPIANQDVLSSDGPLLDVPRIDVFYIHS